MKTKAPLKSGRKPVAITEKEMCIMKMLWNDGPLFVREMLERYPEPKPHFNTVSTTVRILEDKGYITHESFGNSYRYSAAVDSSIFRERSFRELVGNFFNNSYKSAVSALVKDEKISVDELREIIEMVEKANGKED